MTDAISQLSTTLRGIVVSFATRRMRQLSSTLALAASLACACGGGAPSATSHGVGSSGAGATLGGGAANASAGSSGSGGLVAQAGSSNVAGANSAGAGGILAAAGGPGVGGVGGVQQSAGAGGAPTAGAGGAIEAPDPNKRRLLLRDEARSAVSYVDLANPAANWHVSTAYGRDMQLVGGDRFMIGSENGYEERALANGALLGQLTSFPGTLTAHRLRNGNTVLAGVNWQGGTGVVLIEVDAAGTVRHQLNYPSFSYVRLVRQTQTGTFLITADSVLFESDASGKILWQVAAAPANSHVWQALRIATGETVLTTGYGASIEIFAADHSLHKTITAPPNVTPYFFGGFEILPNGDYLVANWQGHMGEKQGVQLLELSPQGQLVWSYKPDTTTESLSLHHVIVLDGLDTSKLQVDDTTGALVAVP